MSKLDEILNKVSNTNEANVATSKEYNGLIEQIFSEFDEIEEYISKYKDDDAYSLEYEEDELKEYIKIAKKDLEILKDCYKKLAFK